MGQLLERTIEYSIKKGYIDAAEGERVKRVVTSIASKYGFPEEWLVQVVLVEAEGFNPRVDDGTCAGAIQVCRGFSTVHKNGGVREIGGYEAFKTAGPAKQLEIWEKYHLAYWMKQAKRGPQSAGELQILNTLPAYFLKVAAGTFSKDAALPTRQASFLYTDFDPKTAKRTGGGYWSVNSATKGMAWKVQSVLGKEALSTLDNNTVSNSTSNIIGNITDLATNSSQVISNALSTLNSGIQSALLKGNNCPPPPYTQQDRIIYPGCLQKTNSPIYGNGLGSGTTAPGVNSLSLNNQPNQESNNNQHYSGELKPGGLINPMKKGTYKFTSPFGPRWGRLHRGVDLAAPIGTPIYSSADGVVEVTHSSCPVNGSYGSNCGTSGFQGYGNIIYIRHSSNMHTLYCHLSSVLVNQGDQVKQGQLIAKIGNSGSSTGAHIHYEIRLNGSQINPEKYIKF